MIGGRALRWYFSSTEDDYDRGLNESRALGCEIVAGTFVLHLTQREALEYLCYELPAAHARLESPVRSVPQGSHGPAELPEADERVPLLDGVERSDDYDYHDVDDNSISDSEEPFSTTFAGLNALEIAAVAGAKKFLGEKPVQNIVNGIWNGDIVFWDTMSTHSVMKP